LIKERVPRVPVELIFNIDECNFGDWEDRKAKPVLIPRNVKSATVRYPVERRIQHQTLICCIATAAVHIVVSLSPQNSQCDYSLKQKCEIVSILKSRL
jgi:hypothetical protein